MRQRPSVTEGFTLVELLVAMFIFGIVLTLISNLVTDMMKGQGQVNSRVQVQMNLRRATEIISQDLRNASFGALTDTPNVSTATAFSVAQPLDTAVYPVSAGGSTFKTANILTAVVPSGFTWASGTDFLLVNPITEQFTALKLSRNATASTAGSLVLRHTEQPNTICPSGSNVVQAVTRVGYRYDASTKILYRSVSTTTGWNEAPLVFDVTNFNVVYESNTGSRYTSPADVRTAGEKLSRVVFTLATENKSSGQGAAGQLSTSVELPQVFNLTTNPLQYIQPGTTLSC